MTKNKQQTLLSIDPGVSTGIALISYTDDTEPELVEGWQFTGGAMALSEWEERHFYREVNITPELQVGDPLGELYCVEVGPRLTIVAEKFTARNTSNFSYTTASLEPLRCEGVLLARNLMPDYSPKEPRWRDPSLQYLVGGTSLPDKKKRQHRFLKDIGFYRTNKDFPDSPAKDGADDFRSAAAHGLAFLARTGHKPTYGMIADWVRENG